MLIGAHVSAAGGLPKAAARGVAAGCEAIQIFPQSSRMWRATPHSDADVAEFRAAVRDSPIERVLIHAVYLINCASLEAEIRAKSIAALRTALELGDRIGADGVVLHPGSQKGRDYDDCMRAAGAAIAEALAETEKCPLLLEDTAGANGTLGRDFDELARLLELAGDHPRLGLCLDSCHLLASGFEVRDQESLARIVDECDIKVGLARLRALHVNDSKMPLGSNRDRHADLGQGELGESGLRVFLSEPRFEGLPAVLETARAGDANDGAGEVALAKRLLGEGLADRAAAR